MKTLSLMIFIALQHLRVRFRQSLVAVLSVAMGAMILLVTLAMMEGLLVEFKDKLLEASPPVGVEPPSISGPVSLFEAGPWSILGLTQAGAPNQRDEITRYPEREAVIESIPGVSEAAPRACAPVIMYHGDRSERSLACGIDPAAEKSVTRLWKWMVEGKMDDLRAVSGGIVMGKILARRLSAERGSRVRVVSPAGVVQDFKVVGIFASGITKIDDSQAFVRLSEGRRLAGLDAGSVTAIGVGVADIGDAEAVARAITRRVGLEALTWEEANQSAIAQFRMQGIITYFLVVFTAVVGGFGILNIMVTIVMEKVKDIAILRSMGYTARQVLGIFFFESLALGAAGGLIGCVAGAALSMLIQSMPMEPTEAGSIQRDEFTMLLEPSFFVIAFSISLAISVAAGLSPARRAARVDPVEVLRGER